MTQQLKKPQLVFNWVQYPERAYTANMCMKCRIKIKSSERFCNYSVQDVPEVEFCDVCKRKNLGFNNPSAYKEKP